MSIARAYTRDMSEAELNWHDMHYQTLTPGQRAADHMRNGMGSWIFIGIFIGFMALWALINLTTRAWDPYPFILLNLFLSMLAGLQGAILLIAAKRQDAISAALAQHDFAGTQKALRQWRLPARPESFEPPDGDVDGRRRRQRERCLGRTFDHS